MCTSRSCVREWNAIEIGFVWRSSTGVYVRDFNVVMLLLQYRLLKKPFYKMYRQSKFCVLRKKSLLLWKFHYFWKIKCRFRSENFKYNTVWSCFDHFFIWYMFWKINCRFRSGNFIYDIVWSCFDHFFIWYMSMIFRW